MKTLVLSMLILSCISATSQTSATLDFEGETRTFTYYAPATLPPQPSMLVLVLHGATQDGAAIANVSNMHQFTNSHNAIVVYPDGIGNTWNVGLNIGGSTANDVGFLDALIDYFIAEMGADSSKVFSCGFSNGGYMSYKMACESTHCISAVASVAGVMTEQMIGSCSAPGETSIMHFHGTSDFIVSYNGSSISGASVDNVIEHWRNANACSTEAIVQQLPNINLVDLSTVEKTVWANCNGEADITLFKISGGGHQWPDTDALLGGLGAINRDINASEEIINFFSQSSCPAILNTPSIQAAVTTLFPNPFQDEILITLPNNRSVLVEVFDFNGRKIHQYYCSGTCAIDSKNWSSGIYYIKSESTIIKAIKL